ncbi:signal peptidase I [Psychromicrobium lacuslunae]|uniref:Signal peptidase I n=1 Tax=Psychromicrobium lacuslunae TaxID=1618207 RepID=A0A0D4BYN8_9MICC|nr:signal peptidase I [Psychromicrobium lacuslunae]AJT41216.1 signal peptidase I [Psychromicrobium lacuslunae]
MSGVAKRQSRRLGWRFVLLIVLVIVLVSSLIRAFWLEVYYIPSESMNPQFLSGERVAVSRTDYGFGPIHRGDLVVFDGRGSFDPLDSGRGAVLDALHGLGQFIGVVGSDTVYVKRVIGIAGDRVKCCSVEGKITVNGESLNEPYLFPGDAPSATSFDVVVPAGKLWLMGDHRSISADSRSLLGAPGGGLISLNKVIGRPIQILWPLDKFGNVPRVPIGPDAQKGAQ